MRQALSDSYTRGDVVRMLGVTARQLRYWERLRLVRPQGRSSNRRYDFRDLLALRTLQNLTEQRVPAYRVKRALEALERETGQPLTSLTYLRALPNGRDVVFIPPPPDDRPFAPLKRQFVLGFFESPGSKLRAMASRTAEQWVEVGLELEGVPEQLPQAADAFRHATELAPDWTEAWMSLGSVLYQLNRIGEACEAFRNALRLEPENPGAHLNLGCTLYEQGQLEAAIGHFQMAVQLAPSYAEAHMNLALACEKRNSNAEAREHWAAYLRVEPEGTWADYARTRLGRPRVVQRSSKTIPFPKTHS